MPTTFFGWVGFLLEQYGPLFLRGAGMTMLIAVISTALGCVIGFAVGIVQTIPADRREHPVRCAVMRVVRFVLGVYVEVFRGTPMMVQAMVIFYVIPYMGGPQLPTLQAAILIISINTGAYMAESVRGGIISIDPGQTEGAKAIGMNHYQTMTSVILPQALRNIMPQIGNNFIINVKDTSVMFIIGFMEFFAFHRQLVGLNNMYFPSATIEMVGYLAVTLTASFILRWVERRMDGKSSYELVQSDQLTMSAGTYNYPDRGTPFDERSPEYRERIRQSLRNRNGSMRGDR